MITYFPHDVNARNDEKMLDLRMEMGPTGIGIYWMLLEKLATANGQRLEYDLRKLSWDLHINTEDIVTVVEGFGLFEIEDPGNGRCKVFYSKRLCEHAQQVESVAAKRSRAGRAGAERRTSANTLGTVAEVNSGETTGTVADTEPGKVAAGSAAPEAQRTEPGTVAEVADDKQMLNTCQANAKQMADTCKANAEPKKRIEKNKIKIKENKIKENSSSSENAHEREEGAAEAAEEEEGCFECDLFELRTKAMEAIKEVYAISTNYGVTPISTVMKTARWLSCKSDTDRETLKTIMVDTVKKSKNFGELSCIMQMADKQRPIGAIPLPYWDAMQKLEGLNSGDRRMIAERLGRNRQRWDDLVKALGEVNEKIRQPGRFLLSRI